MSRTLVSNGIHLPLIWVEQNDQEPSPSTVVNTLTMTHDLRDSRARYQQVLLLCMGRASFSSFKLSNNQSRLEVNAVSFKVNFEGLLSRGTTLVRHEIQYVRLPASYLVTLRVDSLKYSICLDHWINVKNAIHMNMNQPCDSSPNSFDSHIQWLHAYYQASTLCCT